MEVRLPEEEFLFWTGLWKLEQVYERELEVIEWFIKRALELLL